MSYYTTDTQGIGGYLRKRFEDFQVTEAPVEKTRDANGEYTHFNLEKTNWDTIKAINTLSKVLGVSRKRFGFAGTKDRRAVTRQRIGVWKVGPDKLLGVNIKDLRLYDFIQSSERILIGDLLGNEFEITVRNPEAMNEGIIKECKSQIDGRGVPNYFGYQRFGTIRPNTHIVGKLLLKGDIEGAVMSYLADYYPDEREDAMEARKDLKETGDFKLALETFPKRLSYERTMLDHLYKQPTDFAGAFRRLHKKLRQMFVHGYQSYLFNRVLSRAIEGEMDIKGMEIPLVGYDNIHSYGEHGGIVKKVLDEEEVRLLDFKTPSLPELSARGAMRNACLETNVFYQMQGDGSILFRFFLPKGSYATMVMREFMKTEPLRY